MNNTGTFPSYNLPTTASVDSYWAQSSCSNLTLPLTEAGGEGNCMTLDDNVRDNIWSYVIYDLGGLYALTGFTWYLKPRGFNRAYVSEDKSTWTLVSEKYGYSTEAWQTVSATFAQTNARYVKFMAEPGHLGQRPLSLGYFTLTGTVTGTGNVNTNADMLYCALNGSDYDIAIGASGAVAVYACQYDPDKVTGGTVTMMDGDRAAIDHTHDAANLDDLADVTITTPADGELIRYDGSGWINNTLAEAGIAAADHTHTIQLQVFQEDHSSDCDGSETTFYSSQAFTGETTHIFLNGLLQQPDVDYTEIGNRVIEFTTAPISGDVLIFAYVLGEMADSTNPYVTLYGDESTVIMQLHNHTDQSDGALTPTEITTNYHTLGHEAHVITDHDIVTAVPDSIVETELEGCEQTTSNGHILSIGCDYTRSSETDRQTIIDGAIADGGAVFLAHPKWYVGFSQAVMAALTGYHGIEIFNMHCQTQAGSYSPVTYPGFDVADWDYLLTNARQNIWGIAVDDFHSSSHLKSQGIGRLHVFVSTNTAANVLAALKAGNFVADVGMTGLTPTIPNISSTGMSLNVSGATRIRFIGDNGTLLQSTEGESGSYTFDGDTYVRAEVVTDYTEGFGSAIDTTYTWGVESGSWSVGSGILSQATNSDGPFIIILKKHREGDFEATCKVRVAAGTGNRQGGLLFNVLTLTNMYYLDIDIDEATEKFKLYVYPNNANPTKLAAANKTINGDTWYTMRLQYTAATGGIKARVWESSGSEPGTWDIDITDTTHKTGAFGFRTRYACDFDDLWIDGFKLYYQPIKPEEA